MNEKAILVHGLGYVGLATSLGLAQSGFTVYATDISETKINELKQGHLSLSDESLLAVFDRYKSAITFLMPREISNLEDVYTHILCVGTPSKSSGEADLGQVESVINSLLDINSLSNAYLNIILRSTVPPGSCRKIEEQLSSKKNWELYHYPEFLREGQAMQDFNDPPLELIGHGQRRTRLKELTQLLTSDNCRQVSFEESELIKYICNAFHALKITFSNEVANLCHKMGINSERVMDSFCKDTKLNISRAYLRPGFSFGGICLEKDLKALLSLVKNQGSSSPILESILPSNQIPFERTIKKLLSLSSGLTLGISGVAFKPNTGDIRYSKILDLALDERIQSHFKKVLIYDDSVCLEKISKNSKLITYSDSRSLINDSDVLLFGSKEVPLTSKEIFNLKGKQLLDLRFFARQSHILNSSGLNSWGIT